MSDSVTDLVAGRHRPGGARHQRARHSSLVARKIGSSRRVAIASEACIAAYGEPRHPSDLSRMPCVIFTGVQAPTEWHFEGPDGPVTVSVSGRFRTDNGEGVREAVLAGLGFAVLPTWFFGSEGDGRPPAPGADRMGAAAHRHHRRLPIPPQPGAANPRGDRLPRRRVPPGPGDLRPMARRECADRGPKMHWRARCGGLGWPGERPRPT